MIKKALLMLTLPALYINHLNAADSHLFGDRMKPDMSKSIDSETIRAFLQAQFPAVYAEKSSNSLDNPQNRPKPNPDQSVDQVKAGTDIIRRTVRASRYYMNKNLDEEAEKHLKKLNTKLEAFIRQRQTEALALKYKCEARTKSSDSSDLACEFVDKILDGTIYREMLTNVVESVEYDCTVICLGEDGLDGEKQMEKSISKYGEVSVTRFCPLLDDEPLTVQVPVFSAFMAALNPSSLDRIIQ